MANTTYTVVKGDTLSKIAAANNTTVDELVRLNALTNPNYIVVGQVLTISGSATKVKWNTSSQANVRTFGLQSDTTSTMYAVWSWDKSNTKEYQIQWYYDTGDGVWFIGEDTTTTSKQSLYTAPDNANRVKFTVRPVSNTRIVRNKETSYWTAKWSTAKIYDFINNPPTTPPTPSVTIEDYRLTAKLENLDVNAISIQFKVVQDDTTVYKISNTTIRTATNSAQYACIVTAGSTYKVAARSVRGTVYSDWSEFSSPIVTIPSAPSKITTCRANSETSVYLEWEKVETAETYDVEYTTKREYFDGSNATTTQTGIESIHYELTGLDSGEEYFFRVRAVNDAGESGWSEITSVVIGKAPSAPTTWSSTTTAITGEALNLYWVHNARDESSQTYAELELIINGGLGEVYTIKNSTDEDEKDKTSVYPIDTSEYVEGTKILWRVRTAGVTKVYGDWSIQRTIDIYAPPTLALDFTDSKGSTLTQLESFPFYISALAGPKTQEPIGYHLSITANEGYQTVDDIGNNKFVSKGEEVYSKYFDISSALLVEFTPANIDLENNISYTVTCSVTMNSGLSVETDLIFTVAWMDMEYEPNAEIGIDYDNLSAIIRPYCEDENGHIVMSGKNICPGYKAGAYGNEDGIYSDRFANYYCTELMRVIEGEIYTISCGSGITPQVVHCWDSNGVWIGKAQGLNNRPEGTVFIAINYYTSEDLIWVQVELGSEATEYEPYVNQEVYLSVYRREFDGSFTEIIKNTENSDSLFVTDPHPALDYVRYRIVATSKTTGGISYTDLAGYPVGETAIVLQWNEEWTSFDTTNEDELAEPTWSGSFLKLPYNVDVSDTHNNDVTTVEYIGRKRPVSYYGTQLGHTATWNVAIPKDDKETLYALRRLAIWMGDVYVREPSGSGYWANVSVSFSQKHLDLTIPVTLNITRVEGGM